MLDRRLAARGDRTLSIRGPRVHASADSSSLARPTRSETEPLPARRIANSGHASGVATRSACIPGRPALHSRSCKKCIHVSERESPVLRKHWKDKHGLSSCKVLGESGAVKQGMMAKRLQFSVRRPVPCQRVCASGHGSQYFEVYIDIARPTVDTTLQVSANDAILKASESGGHAAAYRQNICRNVER